MADKYVYFFGAGKAEGAAEMKNLLGGKGANIAEMTNIGIPVPAGFTITTEVCTYYYDNGNSYPEQLKGDVEAALAKVEDVMGAKFGDVNNPLLVSVRSGARVSMPGMMDTVLNVGLNDETIKGLIAKTGNERFAYDAYRRFVNMYADVVLGVGPEHEKDDDPFEVLLDKKKEARGVKLDTELTTEDLKELVGEFKALVKQRLGQALPRGAHGSALGRHRRGVRLMEHPQGHQLPPDQRHSRGLGHGGQRPVHGLRQHGR